MFPYTTCGVPDRWPQIPLTLHTQGYNYPVALFQRVGGWNGGVPLFVLGMCQLVTMYIIMLTLL